MSEDISLSQPTHRTNHPLAWSLVLFLAGLAWILTLCSSVRMLTLPMYGTMGMAFLPFLGFWTVMMAAMMLPALAPTVSVQMALLRQQSAPPLFQASLFRRNRSRPRGILFPVFEQPDHILIARGGWSMRIMLAANVV